MENPFFKILQYSVKHMGRLSRFEIAQMIDVSAVQANSTAEASKIS